MKLSTDIGLLRLLALLEGISYLAFALTMPLKYFYEMPGPNRIVGTVHGVLFILYCLFVFVVNRKTKWSLKTNMLAYAASLIPAGTFVADAKIFKIEQSKRRMETKKAG